MARAEVQGGGGCREACWVACWGVHGRPASSGTGHASPRLAPTSDALVPALRLQSCWERNLGAPAHPKASRCAQASQSCTAKERQGAGTGEGVGCGIRGRGSRGGGEAGRQAPRACKACSQGAAAGGQARTASPPRPPSLRVPAPLAARLASKPRQRSPCPWQPPHAAVQQAVASEARVGKGGQN